MHTGMLWFNNDKTMTLEQKIKQAVDYYQKKYGRVPNLVLIHPSVMEENRRQFKVFAPTTTGTLSNELTIRPYRPVLPGHIWIGIADEK